MRLRTFHIGIGLISLLFLPAHAMNSEEEEKEKNPNCRIIFQEIEEANKTLKDYESRNGQIPEGTKNTYREYLRDLVNLYEQAKDNENLNVSEKLFYITRKYF